MKYAMGAADSTRTRKGPLLLLVAGLALVGLLFYILFLKTGNGFLLIIPGALLLLLLALPFLMHGSGSENAGLQARSVRNGFDLLRKGQVVRTVKHKEVVAAVVCLQYPCLILCLERNDLLLVEGEFARMEKMSFMNASQSGQGQQVGWRKLYQHLRHACRSFEQDGVLVAQVNDVDGWLGTLNALKWKKRIRTMQGPVANEYLVIYERPMSKA
jgi:hypothetical protein